MIEIRNSTIGNFVGGNAEQSTQIIGGCNSSIQLVDANVDENRNHRAILRLSQAVRPRIIIGQGNRVKAILSNFGISWSLYANQNCSVRARVETIESKKPFIRFP
jgi:hypothetical protein